jgi:hypothetical protein
VATRRADWRGVTACPALAVLRARVGTTGSGRAGTRAGAATRGLDPGLGVGRSSGIVTLISGSGIAPGVVGAALGVLDGSAGRGAPG